MFGDEEREEAEEKARRKKLLKQIDELVEFRGLNEKFNYLGLEMIVLAHSYTDCYSPIPFPLLKAKYVDKAGHIQEAKFKHKELPALISENRK